MNTNKYIAWCSACIVICAGILTIILDIDIRRNNNSTPVEEMYYRQLVITLDSVLDAHLNAATLKELKDKDSIGIADRTHYEKYFVPMEE